LALHLFISPPSSALCILHCCWICNAGCDNTILRETGPDQGPQHHPS
jgi:hypothetical protein